MKAATATIAAAEEETEHKPVDQTKVSQQLPFSTDKQEAVLGHLLTNKTFFLTCKDRIKPSWWVESLCQRIWTAMLDFYTTHRLIPNPGQELREHPLLDREGQGMRNAIAAKITKAMHQASLYHLKALEAELTDWLRSRLFSDGVMLATDTWNRGQMQLAYQQISKANRDIQDTVFHPDEAASFVSLEPLFAETSADMAGALTFGLAAADKLILKGAVDGGLLAGGTTIFLGATDTGKSSTLITVACANIKRGKAVLFVMHEGIVRQVQLKFLCCMLGENMEWLLNNYKNPDPTTQSRITSAQKWLNQFLVLVPYIKAGMTVETVVSIVRRRQEERATKLGKGFDLLIDDYAAKLSTEEAKGGKLEKRQRDEIVYNNFLALALEYKFHHIGAIQTNREGSKINKGFKGYEDRLLEMEDVAETMAVMNDAHLVITINRPPLAVHQGWITYHIAKSKFGSTGWAIVCKSNFGCGVTHSNELGCIWYQGSSSSSERIQELLATYKDRQLPETEKL